MPESRKLVAFRRQLQSWYKAKGRTNLPWRNTSDPYEIYISEIMLQQTQVATVLERFYTPFLRRFPTLSSLAKATQKEVLQSWQGLGYYSRAGNLHKAAQQAGAQLPKTVDELIALPGIGRNTAHAIAAFAYHQPVAVMEANVKRVLCRIFALTHPTDTDLWEKATQLLDKNHPFDYNQAMMDIGATICTKRSPRCSECPASTICEGQKSPELYPAPKTKKTTPIRHKRIAIFQNTQGEYYATPRKTRFLNGLYHFVELDMPSRRRPGSTSLLTKKEEEIIKLSITQNGATWIPAYAGMTKIGEIRQQYSHFTLEAELYIIPGIKAQGNGWHSPSDLAKLPVSMAEKKIIELLTTCKI